MEKVLIFIKHHIGVLWKIIEWGNNYLFLILYNSRLKEILPSVFIEFNESPYEYKQLAATDAESLYNLIHNQNDSDLKYFNPHGFDMMSIKQQFKSSSFLMMGTFDSNNLIGYFFLRFFPNRKCFVGRLIDKSYRGKGIGIVMNNIMYETAWRMKFRCLSTISRNNKSVMKAHAKNPTMAVIKELQNEYILVEFIKKNTKSI